MKNYVQKRYDMYKFDLIGNEIKKKKKKKKLEMFATMH